MCHYLKYDLFLACVTIIVLKYIISTILNGKKHAIFCWTQIQRSDGGHHILVWPCIPAIRYAILVAKSIFLPQMNTAAAAVVHSGRKRQKEDQIRKKYILRFQKILTIINSWLLMLVMVLYEKILCTVNQNAFYLAKNSQFFFWKF